MYKNLSSLIFLIATICLPSKSISQENVVNGIVTTFDSIPLIGAQVKVKSSNEILTTDSLGNFVAHCRKKDKLIVTANGYYSRKARLNDKTKIAAINLRIKPGEKNKELAIGYGSTTDKNKIGALTNLEHDDFDFSIYPNIYELIKGRLSGVQVYDKRIRIRGSSSWSSSNDPLIIVNGSQISIDALNNIPPSTVKNISVIKDASAAIYGTRGANGVILIETKSGGDE